MIIEQPKPVIKKAFDQGVRKDLYTHFVALSKETRYALTQRHNYAEIAMVFKNKITLTSAISKLETKRDQVIQILDDTTLPGPMMETFEAQCASYAQFDAIARFLRCTYREASDAQ